jgi:ribosomal protein S12 methylthiotransferase
VSEIEQLLSQNVFELNLVAQDLGSFGFDRGSREIGRLLGDIAELPNDFWIRLLYVHPDNFPPEILEIVERDPRFLPYLDLPFQHASEKILSAMGRKGNAEINLNLIDRIRGAVPSAVIRSTFLVGFPGETEDDFRRLRDFQDRACIDWLGIFAYSREEGTAAARFAGQVGVKTAARRKHVLEEAQVAITADRLDRFVGRELTCLIEETVVGEELSLGRAYLQAPEVDGLVVVRSKAFQPGDRPHVRIIKRNGVDLEAIPVASRH